MRAGRAARPSAARRIPVAFRILGPDGAAADQLRDRPDQAAAPLPGPRRHQRLPAPAPDARRRHLDDDGRHRRRRRLPVLRRVHPARPRRRSAIRRCSGLPFVIAGDTKLAPLPAPAADQRRRPLHRAPGSTASAHLRVGRATLLRFRVPGRRRSNRYLGAIAHMSAFEVRTQALTHLHAGRGRAHLPRPVRQPRRVPAVHGVPGGRHGTPGRVHRLRHLTRPESAILAGRSAASSVKGGSCGQIA